MSVGGADFVFGDAGRDSIEGGPGNDHLWGGAGEDDLDAVRSAIAVSTVSGSTRFATLGEYSEAFGAVDADPGARGDDIISGGLDRDLMQADAPGDRLADAHGNYNLFLVCGASYGESIITRSPSPGVVSFFGALATSDGAVGAVNETDVGNETGAAEAAIVSNSSKGNSGSPYPGSPGHFTVPAGERQPVDSSSLASPSGEVDGPPGI